MTILTSIKMSEEKEPIVGETMEIDGQVLEITRVDDFRDFWHVSLRSPSGVLSRIKVMKQK